MPRFLKLLTLCLLMIAMPFKGVAGASLAICDPVHDHASHGGAHGEQGHDHGSGADAGHPADQLTDHANVAVNEQHPAAVNDQSPCANCGAHAIAGSPEDVMQACIRASSIVIPFLSSMHVGVFTDGLERPPKTIFA